MFALSQSLSSFYQSLENGSPVVFVNQDSWQIESRFSHLIRILTFQENSRLEGIRSAFCAAMDALEYYNACDQELYLITAEKVYGHIKHLRGAWELDYRIYALRGRLGLGERPSESYDFEFLAEVCNWRQSLPYSPNGTLSRKQEAAFDAVVKYPQFIQMLRREPLLKDAFLNWSIRDENNPHVFMRFPALTQKMVDGCIAARIGLDDILLLTENSLYLRCEGGNLDLRNLGGKVHLSEGYKVTLEDICNCFINRNRVFGNIESNALGFINWSSRHFGKYDAKANGYKRINFNKTEWWDQLPYESVSDAGEMKHRFQLDTLPDGASWYYSCVGASESNREVLVKGTHGYTLISIPQGKEKYLHYSFGKFMHDDFPVGALDNLRVALQSVHGRIVCPDGTAKNTERDKEFITVRISAEEGKAIMEDIKQDILQGLRREIPFQLFADNCMHWSIEKIQHKLDPIQRQICYVKPFKAKQAKGMLRIALFIYSLVPSIIMRPLLNAFAWCFGGYQQLAFRSRDGRELSSSFASRAPWAPEEFECANPSILLLRRRSGKMG